VNTKGWSRSQKVAGLTTITAMLLAFALANSPARDWYQVVHHLPVMVRVGTLAIDKPLILWINDGLMVFFFLLIALELKREVMEGQLSTYKSIATPAFAALGGMAVPALIYTAFNLGDLGAISVIALFYTEQLAMTSLMMATFGIATLAGLNIFNVTRTAAYVVVGVVLWVAVLKSGVHVTLAGMAIGLAMPMKVTQNDRSYSPLRETEHQLYPWVAPGAVGKPVEPFP
jgi:Na+:H+ antiporter, NhaA family